MSGDRRWTAGEVWKVVKKRCGRGRRRKLQELNEMQRGVPHRAARLYKFDERKYRQLVRRGLSFGL